MNHPAREPGTAAGISTVPSFEALRATVQSGNAIVARFPGLVLAAAAEGASVQRLLEICGTVSVASSRAPGKVVARRLAGWLADVDQLPEFGVIAATDDALAVFLCGRTTLLIPGERALSGAGAAWVDRLIPWPPASFVLTLGGSASVRPTPLLDLRVGVVPGEGLLLAPRSTPHAAPAPDRNQRLKEAPWEPLPEATGPDKIATPAAPDAENGVIIEGYECPAGHLNDPRAQFCASCGRRMVGRTQILVPGPRPPLGLLVFDDGASFNLDEDYLLGRQPEVDERVRDGSVRPLMIDDSRRLVGRAHLEIQLQGWDVYINDTGSVNGTYVATPEAAEWSALIPGRPLRLPPGTRVSIGSRTFVFESSLAR